MTDGQLKKVRIALALFSMAFDRDEDYHDASPQEAYLDKTTGEIHWIWVEDEDAYSDAGISASENAALRRRIEDDSEKFLLIPGRSHGEHHDLLRAFLASDWTDDESLRVRVRAAYTGSIGRWKNQLDDESIVFAFYDYRDKRLTELAAEFLRDNNLEPVWA